MDETEALRSWLPGLLERVREGSRDGAVLRLDEACRGDFSGAREAVRCDEEGEPDASGAGEVVRVDEVEPGSTSGAGVSPAALIAFVERETSADLSIVHAGRHVYLYSTRHMTPQYAEMAARAAEGDVLRLIAEKVRADSATYPRPTSIETFAERPFNLAGDEVLAGFERMAANPGFEDIRQIAASDGALFLFSVRHLDPAHAASLAEWLAVGRSNNP